MNPFSRRSFLRGLGAAGAAPALARAGTIPRASGVLNVIQIVVDTWSAHWLGCYGNPAILTPNVDALAAKSVMFMDAYPNGLPTVLVRRALYTGRQVFPAYMVRMREGGTGWRGWHPLYREDATLAESMYNGGYKTQLISDVYHQFQPNMNFQFGFNSFKWIRGQETDRSEIGPKSAVHPELYMHPTAFTPLYQISTYLQNRWWWKQESDWSTARLFTEANNWLDDNVSGNDPFYLHIECYSPHEMWDPPEDYYRLYMKSNYSGPRLIYPPDRAEDMTPVEIEHVRALYAGMITFADSNIGRFLNKVEAMGLMENTIIVFVADHGTFMGERGNFHKGEGYLRTQLLHVPLLIYHPDLATAKRRIRGYVQHTDVMPTILDLTGQSIPKRVTGESLLPLMATGADSQRQMVYGGWNNHGFVRTPDLSYLGHWNNTDGFEELYDARRDPLELTDISQQNPATIEAFRQKMNDYVASGWPTTKGTFLAADPQ
jgi:arylsulfatase A-like enzyme